jgi:hypothetical protein
MTHTGARVSVSAFSWDVAMVMRLDELSSVLQTSVYSYIMVVPFLSS